MRLVFADPISRVTLYRRLNQAYVTPQDHKAFLLFPVSRHQNDALIRVEDKGSKQNYNLLRNLSYLSVTKKSVKLDCER